MNEQIIAVVYKIPKGKVCSYGVIADLAGFPGRARHVSKALRASEDQQLPWYRVLRSSGQIAFASGTEQARRQQQLLLAEGVLVTNNRVNLKDYLWHPSLGELMELQF